MKLNNFLHFNNRCPICDEPLHLYMQWARSMCFKGELLEPNIYKFSPVDSLKDLSLSLVAGEEDSYGEDAHILLADKGDDIEVIFSSSKLFSEAKKHQAYFYFLCNPLGIKKTWKDYEINLYKGCYYRDTPLMELRKNPQNKEWCLEFIDHDNESIVHKNECFSFKSTNKDIEKIYMLDLDWNKKETTLWHYSVSLEQKKTPSFRPNIFEKKMPLLSTRPKVGIEDRAKLLSRFDNWIIMS